MATGKTELPTLAGKRVKTRKRDEKVKYDPKEFCEQLIASLNEAKTLEDMSKYLDKAGSEMDYRYSLSLTRTYSLASHTPQSQGERGSGDYAYNELYQRKKSVRDQSGSRF